MTEPVETSAAEAAGRLSSRVSPTYAALAAQLRTERERQGLTQRALARRIEDYSTALCNWETGRAVPGIAPLAKWAAGLGFELALVPAGTDLRALLDEREQLHAELEAIGEEWGVRVIYTDGSTFEGACAATEAEARAIIAELDSDLNRSDVVYRVLLVRTITKNGQWRDAETEDGAT